MKKIPSAQVAEGMILARDVEDARGRVLLGKGTALNERQAALLKKNHGGSLYIAESPADTEEQGASSGEMSEAAKKRLERVEHMFSDMRGDPLMEKILELARTQAAKEGARG